MVNLTIAILTYNDDTVLLPPAVQSVLEQDLPPKTEILILDNGSATPLCPHVWHPTQPVQTIRPTQEDIDRRGTGNIVGMNRCFEQAQGEWVLFLANDVRLHRYCLDRLLDAIRHPDGDVAMVQPLLVDASGRLDHVGMNWVWPGYGLRRRKASLDPVLTRVPVIPATCFLMRRDFWQALGGFDESLGLSHEDVDFCLRLDRLVLQRCMYVRHDATATHLGGATIAAVEYWGRQQALSRKYHEARVKVLRKHYRGLDYWTRRLAVEVLDRGKALMS